MTGVETWSTTYWSALADTNLSAADCGINLGGLPTKFQASYLDPNSPVCGSYLQLLSQYPGKGPCDPVIMETVDYFNRWGVPGVHVRGYTYACTH